MFHSICSDIAGTWWQIRCFCFYTADGIVVSYQLHINTAAFPSLFIGAPMYASKWFGDLLYDEHHSVSTKIFAVRLASNNGWFLQIKSSPILCTSVPLKLHHNCFRQILGDGAWPQSARQEHCQNNLENDSSRWATQPPFWPNIVPGTSPIAGQPSVPMRLPRTQTCSAMIWTYDGVMYDKREMANPGAVHQSS